jgi:molecular chaperone DnaJ
MRARGKGAVRKDGTRGDLLVTIEVAVPGDLDDKARKALEEYRAAVPDEDPRAALFEAAKGE